MATEQRDRDEEFFTELTWRVLFQPNRNAKAGTMSAGMVLVVIVCAMLIALLVNAGAIKHRSESKNAGTWRYSVANFVETFASTLQFTSPRSAIDAALGRGTDDTDTGTDTGTVVFTDTAATGGTLDVAQPPTLRTPTAAEPLRMHISGDSIVGIFGNQLKKQATETGLIAAELDYRPSTGLSRPDFFNWPKHLNEVNASDDPEVLVLMFGANDIQGIALGGGNAVQPLTPGWYAEYRKRVGALMDNMRDPENDRMVLWVGALPMGPNSGVEGIAEVDYIYASEAAKRPWVTYLDSWPYFVDGSGAYQAELPDAAGEEQLLREGDNIHLTAAGGDRLASTVLARLATIVTALEPELKATPAQRAPSEITERSEVPKPEGFPEGV